MFNLKHHIIILTFILFFVITPTGALAMSTGSEWTDGTHTFKSDVLEDGRFVISIKKRTGEHIAIGPFPREHYETFLKALISVPVEELEDHPEGPLVRFGMNEKQQLLTISKVNKEKDLGHSKIRLNISKEVLTPEKSTIRYRGHIRTGSNRWKDAGLTVAGTIIGDLLTKQKTDIGETLRDATSTRSGTATVSTKPSEIVVESYGFDMDPYMWSQLIERFVR